MSALSTARGTPPVDVVVIGAGSGRALGGVPPARRGFVPVDRAPTRRRDLRRPRRERRRRGRVAAPLGVAEDGDRQRHPRAARVSRCRRPIRARRVATSCRRTSAAYEERVRPRRATAGPRDRGASRGRRSQRSAARRHRRAAAWAARYVINATGTWTPSVLAALPGPAADSAGRQLHVADYVSADEFAGKRVVIVGAGISAVQLLDEISHVAETFWVTRARAGLVGGGLRHPRAGGGDRGRRRPRASRPAAGQRDLGHRACTGRRGRAPRRRGACWCGIRCSRRSKRTASACRTGRSSRPTSSCGRPASGRRSTTSRRSDCARRTAASASPTAARLDEPRLFLIGYGPSQSTIGANRAGRAAVQRDHGGPAEVARVSFGQRRMTFAARPAPPAPRRRAHAAAETPSADAADRCSAGRTHRRAERLMRSRYTAFVVGDATHLERSWHPRTRPDDIDLDPDSDLDRAGDRRMPRQEEPTMTTGIVEFRASWRQGSRASADARDAARAQPVRRVAVAAGTTSTETSADGPAPANRA